MDIVAAANRLVEIVRFPASSGGAREGASRKDAPKACVLALLMLLVGAFAAGPSVAQEHEVTGKVISQPDSLALPGVNVSVKGTSVGTATEGEGRYSLQTPSPNDTLVFSFVGYETKEVPIAGRSVIDVGLSESVMQTEELVVVGYGTQSQEELTGSVGRVGGEELEGRALTSATNALQGQVPGLTVIQRTGEPGDNSGMARIRGLGTFGNNEPLVLIDGLEGELSEVSPNEIESVSVLKDAAAASIYGVRGANGVILVETKQGLQEEGLEFSYQGYAGAQTITRMPNFLGSADHARLLNEALANEGKDPRYTEQEIQQFESGENPDQYPNTDWIDALAKEAALQQDHNLSLTGKGGALRYRVSFGYLDRRGLIPTLEVDRYNVRANLNADVNDNLSLALKLAGSRELKDAPYSSAGGLFLGAIRTPPTVPLRYSDGTWGSDGNRGNPLREARQDGYSRDQTTNLRGSVNATYEIMEGLSWEVKAGIDTDNDMTESFRKTMTYYNYPSGDVRMVDGTPRYLNNYTWESQDVTLDTYLNFDQGFADHSFDGLVGYSQKQVSNDWFGASIENLPSNSISELDAGATTTERNHGSSTAWALRSVFGRVNYSYLGRYLASANLRYDGSSRFAEGRRYGLFPSFSAAWRISEEPFFDVGFVSELKLRGSWGQLGNDNVGLYSYWPTYATGAEYTFGGQLVPGVVEAGLANQKISWEETTTTDVGFNVEIFESRLSIGADYFYKVTDDILLNLPAPATLGIGAPPQNAASVVNRGWEFTGEYSDEIGNLQLGISGNLSLIDNEVTDLRDTGPFIDRVGGIELTTIQREGLPLNSFYGLEAQGLFQSEEEIDEHATQDPFTSPGDIKYKDQNGDGVINGDDRVYLGSYFPGITYSATINADYKAFDFRLFLQGAGDVKGAVTNEAAVAFFQGAKVREWHKDRWTPENRDASYPRLTLTRNHNRRFSSFWVQDASYLRVKNVQVGYSLPRSLLSRLGASQLRVYASADNLFTFTPFKGFDPESPLGRGGFYPNVTTYTFGLSLGI